MVTELTIRFEAFHIHLWHILYIQSWPGAVSVEVDRLGASPYGRISGNLLELAESSFEPSEANKVS